jgi:hypothetical protein
MDSPKELLAACFGVSAKYFDNGADIGGVK